MKSYTQYNLAQHSTAQHSTAAYCNLNKITIALSLFSSLFIPTLSYAESVSHLGAAIGSDSVAIGQGSLATSTSGVANGHGAIATGGNLTKAQLNEKKQQYDTKLAEINNQNATIIQKDKEIVAKDTEIDITNAALNGYKALKPAIDAKKQHLADLNHQKPVKENDVTDKTANLNHLNDQLTPLRKNGNADQYISFFDLLTSLEWASNKTEEQLAQDLKSKIDEKFGSEFTGHSTEEYREIVELYKRREGQLAGSIQRLKDRIHIDSYYNSTSDDRTYLEDFSYVKPDISNENIDQNYEREYLQGNDTLKYLATLGLVDTTNYYSNSDDAYGNQISIGSHYKYASERSYNIYRFSQKNNNTDILISESLAKAKRNNEFNALLSKNTQPYLYISREIYTRDAYMMVEPYSKTNISNEFINKYNTSLYNNYSTLDKIRFSFKKKGDNEQLQPWGVDYNIGVLDKILGVSTDISSFVNNQDISNYRSFLKVLKDEYRDKIDWSFDKSAIDLNDYKAKLDKVINYYDKIDSILSLYEEIITERQKEGGGDQTALDEKSRRLLAIKSEVVEGMKDMSNFLAGIELVYTDHAREYLEYGKDEADQLINEALNELRLYEPNKGIIKDVNDKVTKLVNNYKAAEVAKTEAEKALQNLNEEIARSALTPEEELNDQKISDKEREKQDKEQEKQRLEDEKRQAEEALARARDELAKSGFANLGLYSYAQGKDAFASGNYSIAIGTSAAAIQTDAIAIGHAAEAKANSAIALGTLSHVAEGADKGIAIGDSAKVTKANSLALGTNSSASYANSVAIGADSTTSRGAKAGAYNAPISASLPAVSFTRGSAGEFSVGSANNLRQITHVAAGSEDTDAVNVWQLKSAIDGLKSALEQNSPTTVAGPKGDKGDTGATGPKGDKGDTGATGPKGDKGDTGAAGPKGDKGDTGVAGPKGDKGDTGVAGPKGDKGDTGATGPKGDKGDTGVAGPKGDKGDTGAAGPKGDKGDTGVAGPKGDKGDTGATGPKGDKGDVGPQGPAGRDGIVGRVTTYTVSGKEKPDQEIVEAINQINSEGIKYVHVNDESAELPNENRINGDASASGRYAIAIGHLSEAIASDSIAVGHNAKANIVNSVALGSNAITVSEQTEYTAGTQSYTHSQAINRLNQMVHQFAGADAIGTVSLGKVGAERRVQHVAAGLISEKSTDAINGSQLHALATAIDKGQLGLVRQEYDENTIHNGVNHNRLTVGAGTGGQEVSFANAGGENRRLAGVAEGINANDAVNKGQLDRAVGKTISRINYIEKKLKGGVANAVAMAGLSQAYLPSQGLVSVGVGNYSGVSSIAVGMSHISDNGKVILRVGGSASQKGTAAASASVGFAW